MSLTTPLMMLTHTAPGGVLMKWQTEPGNEERSWCYKNKHKMPQTVVINRGYKRG
jgi:hypothetical protein